MLLPSKVVKFVDVTWHTLLESVYSMFVWLWLVVNDHKFPAETVFFSHTNQPAVLLHEPATKRTSQPNMLTMWAWEPFGLARRSVDMGMDHG